MQSISVTVIVTLVLVTVSSCHELTLAPGVQTVVDLSPGARPGDDAVLRVLTQPLYDASQVTEHGHVFFYVAGAAVVDTWTLKITGSPEDRAEKTLCSVTRSNMTSVTLAAYSSLQHEARVNVSAAWMRNARVGVGQEVTVQVSTSSPKVIQFDFDLTDLVVDHYELVVESVENGLKCLYVGLSEAGCPMRDTLETVTSSRLWARVSERGYFPIRAHKFGDSVLVSLVPLGDSHECYSHGHEDLTEGDQKTVRLRLAKIDQVIWIPILVSIILTILICVVLLIACVYFWRLVNAQNRRTREHRRNMQNGSNGDTSVQVESNGDLNNGDNSMTVLNPAVDNPSRYLVTESEIAFNGQNTLRKKLCKLIEPVPTRNNKTPLLVNRILRDELCVADMCHRIKDDAYHRRQRSKTFLYLIPLVSLFYLVPSSQMVFAEQRRAKDSGNQETCYLNYGCSRAYWGFDDFNHFISNFGYAFYGFFFVFLVWMKSKFLPRENQPDQDHLGQKGILQQQSLFYCMGLCMVLQGIFSAIFHYCPSNISLQFDTTMMYVILILVFVKTYQFRHPDISANAYTIMYTMVVIIGLEALSLYISSTLGKIVFNLFFSLGYILVISHITVDLYFYGAIQTSFPKFIPIVWTHVTSTRHPTYPPRFWLSLLHILTNLPLLAYPLYRSFDPGPKGLSTPILLILSANVGIFLSYYMVRKVKEIWDSHEGEGTEQWKKMRYLSFLFFLLALILGVAAMYFYMMKHQSRNMTPPESRNMNEPCMYMDFFDNHDLWHFFSATALFLAFIFLLTIDDDLLLEDRKHIRVF